MHEIILTSICILLFVALELVDMKLILQTKHHKLLISCQASILSLLMCICSLFFMFLDMNDFQQRLAVIIMCSMALIHYLRFESSILRIWSRPKVRMSFLAYLFIVDIILLALFPLSNVMIPMFFCFVIHTHYHKTFYLHVTSHEKEMDVMASKLASLRAEFNMSKFVKDFSDKTSLTG